MTDAGRRGTALRWVLVVAVLVVAVVAALWPRDGSDGAGSDPAGPFGVAAPDVAALRQQAALAPCPGSAASTQGSAGAGAAGGSSPLAAVRVPCLGDGSTVALGSALAGRPALLNVWSHTCEPCRDELPVLQAYAAEPGAVEVLGVQVDGSPEAGLALLALLGVRLPSVTDPGGQLRAALGAPQVLPLSYVVDPDGGVQLVNPPVVFRSPADVTDTVRRYLNEAVQR